MRLASITSWRSSPPTASTPNGNRAKLEYDGHDRQAKWIFPSPTRPSAFDKSTPASALASAGALNTGDYEQYGYDANSNRTSLRKRDGSMLTYQYDALNRVTVKTVPERTGLASTHTRDVYYGYDLRGLQTAARFDHASTGEGVLSAWDGFGRSATSTQAMDGASRTLTYLHNANSMRVVITHPDGILFRTRYDGLNRERGLREGGQYDLTLTTYDARGQFAQRRLMDGALEHGATTPGYDAAGRVSALAHDLAGTAADVSWGYGWLPSGQLSHVSRFNDAYSWNGHQDFTRAYAANGLNQYTGAGSAAYCYDPNGNLTADGSHVYLYDVENRLVEMRGQVNTTCTALAYTGTLKAKLRYDPLGRLYEVEGYISGVTQGLTRFLYDGDALVAEYNASGTLLRRYMHGANAGADDPVVWYEGAAVNASARRFLLANHQGSIVAVTDHAGASLAINSYDEYGIPDAASAGTTSFAADIAAKGRFRYTGQAWLPELGMYYYKARMYSAADGRFMQVDPIGYEDQFNLYAYVGNDPVNGVDPTGMKLIVRGPKDHRQRLKESIMRVANATKNLAGRYETLRDSDRTHGIKFGDRITRGAAENTPFPSSYAERPDRGATSETVIDPVYLEEGFKDTQGRDLDTMIAHEVFGNAYEADQGLRDSSDNPETDIPNNEHSAMEIENEFNRAVGRPEEKCYGNKPLDGSSKC